mgnify:CR=1 FL=1|tara:strand:+ start:381 stop:662 length:282 start_codon:yes stop_codon:yes gene_type:complete
MERITNDILKRKVARLNTVYGYKTPPQYKRLKNGKLKSFGKGFILEGSYGKVEVSWADYKRNTGTTSVTYLMSKRQLSDTMGAMVKAYQLKKK